MLRNVARVSHGIGAGSSRAAVEAMDVEVARRSAELTERRRDVLRVITAIHVDRQASDAASRTAVADALERYRAGAR